MAEIRRLAPHDPVPESGRYLIVMRRFAEDAPRMTVIELITSDGQHPPVLTVPAGADGAPLGFQAALRAAQAQADREGLTEVIAVDRTAGPREREVLEHDGDHAIHSEALADTDLEDGEPGSDIRDRPQEAGTNLTPDRSRHAPPPPQGEPEDAEAVEPGSDAPGRAGISGPGSGADSERG